LRVWDAEIGECVLEGASGAITCFQHDQRKVVSGCDKYVTLWDVRKGKRAKDLLAEVYRVYQVPVN